MNRFRIVLLSAALTLRSYQPAPAEVWDYGKGLVELSRYDVRAGTYEFKIKIVSWVPLPDAELRFCLHGPDDVAKDTIVLWRGAIKVNDTLSASYSVSFLLKGRQEVVAEIYAPEGFDEGIHTLGTNILYLEVSDTEVLTSHSGFGDIEGQQVLRALPNYVPELRRRGIYTTRLDSLQIVAPGLLSRIEDSLGITFRHMGGPSQAIYLQQQRVHDSGGTDTSRIPDGTVRETPRVRSDSLESSSGIPPRVTMGKVVGSSFDRSGASRRPPTLRPPASSGEPKNANPDGIGTPSDKAAPAQDSVLLPKNLDDTIPYDPRRSSDGQDYEHSREAQEKRDAERDSGGPR